MQQLIYGCGDNGWGVLRSSPDLTPDTSANLQPLVSVALPAKMSQFPSRTQLAEREPRWRVAPCPDGWYVARSIEAGHDASGRPGNVVTHAALIPRTRPGRGADWFFATGWVEPFGSRATADVDLPNLLGEPGGWADTAAWLRDDPSRIATLKNLTGHAAVALVDGATVVLRAESVAELARWVSSLTWLLPESREPQIRVGEDPVSLRGELTNSGPQIIGVCFDAATLCGPHLYLDTSALPPASTGLPITQLVEASTEAALEVFDLRERLAYAIRQGGGTAEEETNTLTKAWATMTDGAEAGNPVSYLPSAEPEQDPDDDVLDDVLAKVMELGDAVLGIADRVTTLESHSQAVWPQVSQDLSDWVDEVLIGIFREENTLNGWQNHPAVAFELAGLFAAYLESVKPTATGWEKVGWLRDRESCMQRIRDWLQRHESVTPGWSLSSR